jgi:hypothetical protein
LAAAALHLCFARQGNMRQQVDTPISRRDAVRALMAMAVTTAASTTPPAPTAADSETDSEKRRARYQADSPEVQTFYRVNRYPAR